MNNETTFAKYWMEANAALMDAIANPSSDKFKQAMRLSALAIGQAYATGRDNAGCEWEMGQSLSRLVRDVALENGYRL